MANSNPTSKSDQALAGATANALPVATAAGALAFDGNHTWNATTRSHVTKGVPLSVATLSTYTVTSNVVVLTAAAPLGGDWTTDKYVTIAVSDGNTWLNGTYLLSAVNVGGNPNRFQVVIAHADAAGGVVGTATINPQAANLVSHQAGDGTDLVTVGPRGKVTLSGSVREDGGVLDIVSRNPNAPRIMRVYSAGVDDARFYIAANGGLYTHWEIICSGSSSGSGAGYTVLPPTTKALMVGVWMDVGVGVAIRGNAISGGQALQILDQNAIFKMTIRADDGRIDWMSTATSDGNGLVTGDTNLYRVAAGKLGTDSIFTLNVTTGATANALEVRDTAAANALRYFVDSSGNPTINNANSRITLGALNNFALYHDGSNGTAENHVGSYSIMSTSAGGSVAIGTNSANRVLIDFTGNVVLAQSALTTTATDRFTYLPSCAGPPTGVPTAKAGAVPMVVDSTNNKIYFYINGSWKGVTVA